MHKNIIFQAVQRYSLYLFWHGLGIKVELYVLVFRVSNIIINRFFCERGKTENRVWLWQLWFVPNWGIPRQQSMAR